MPELITDRLILRQWQEKDLPLFAAMNDDPIVMQFMPKRLNREESDIRAKKHRDFIEKNGWGLWAVEISSTKQFIGYVGLVVPTFDAPFMPCVEVGWRLSSASWGKGFATEAAQKAISYGFDQLALPEIVSFTIRDNLRSLSVMRKLGMTYNPEDDFNHPNLTLEHPFSRHVLYRLTNHQKHIQHHTPLTV